MKPPRRFFEETVKPSYSDWREKPRAEHRARATVGFLNDMADWMFLHLELNKTYGIGGTGKYRAALTESCPDFGLLRDVADGIKHYQLRRSNRKISTAEQTGRSAFVWETWGDRWEDAAYNWEDTGDLLIVELDNGVQRSLISIVNNVISMWKRLLHENGI